MRNRQGTPIWYELMTDDPDSAQTVYGCVMGWTFDKPYGGVNKDYRAFTSSDGERVGGVMRSPDGASSGSVLFGWAKSGAMPMGDSGDYRAGDKISYQTLKQINLSDSFKSLGAQILDSPIKADLHDVLDMGGIG